VVVILCYQPQRHKEVVKLLNINPNLSEEISTYGMADFSMNSVKARFSSIYFLFLLFDLFQEFRALKQRFFSIKKCKFFKGDLEHGITDSYLCTHLQYLQQITLLSLFDLILFVRSNDTRTYFSLRCISMLQ